MTAGHREQIPIQPLTLFLVKAGTRHLTDALEDTSQLRAHRLSSSLPFEGRLFLAPQRQRPPAWLTFLQEGTQENLGGLLNASASAVLLIRSSRRIFALTFGYGRTRLRPDRIERSFGLRVVLNTVDHEGLRSLDTRTVQELSVHTRRQTSRASRLDEFGIDKEEDLLGAATGVPRDRRFARMVSGADALQLRARVAFRDLGNKCTAILKASRSNEYRKRGFEFVDHVANVTDPTLVKKLSEGVAASLRAGDFHGIHMAPPEIVDWQQIDGFSFLKSADPEPDLQPESLMKQIRRGSELTPERLKRQKVFLHFAGSAEPVARWSVFEALVAERFNRSRRYVLSGGEWHALNRGFAARIAAKLQKIPSANLRLPAAFAGEIEEDYNKRAAQRRGIFCIDRKCPRIDGDPIELCDLFTSRRQFVHVKRWNASSTLSHLFAQGRIAAEALCSDETYRRGARTLLAAQATSLARLIPEATRPVASSYQVVFAIIKGGKLGWRRSLPFFSQLHLVRAAEALRRLGFDVRLERIPLEA